MTTKKLLHIALGGIALFLLSSCADTGYYGYGASYSSGYYGGSLAVLPRGYTQVYVGSVPYYYHGNTWYRRSGGRYISCARPHGYKGSIGTTPPIPATARHAPYPSRSSYYGRSHSPSTYRSSHYSRSSRTPSPSTYRSGAYRSSLRTPQNYRPGSSYTPRSTRYTPSSSRGSRSGIHMTPRTGRSGISPRSTPPSTPRVSPRCRGSRDGSRGGGGTSFVRSGSTSGDAARAGGDGRGDRRRNR